MISRSNLILVSFVLALFCGVGCYEVDRSSEKRVLVISDLKQAQVDVILALYDNQYTNPIAFVTELQPNLLTNLVFQSFLPRDADRVWINSELSHWVAYTNDNTRASVITNLALAAKYHKKAEELLIGISFEGKPIEGEQLTSQLRKQKCTEIWRKDINQ